MNLTLQIVGILNQFVFLLYDIVVYIKMLHKLDDFLMI